MYEECLSLRKKGQRAPKNQECVCMCVRPYLVGSTGGVESICSTNKQGVIILLQEDFDEIVTLVLQGAQVGRERKTEKRNKVHGDICVFYNRHLYTESHMWFLKREALSFLSFEAPRVVLYRQVRGM